MADIETDSRQENNPGENVLYLGADCLRLLEDEYWAELDTDILMGWKTHEEATDTFLAWRSGYRVIEIALDSN